MRWVPLIIALAAPLVCGPLACVPDGHPPGTLVGAIDAADGAPTETEDDAATVLGPDAAPLGADARALDAGSVAPDARPNLDAEPRTDAAPTGGDAGPPPGPCPPPPAGASMNAVLAHTRANEVRLAMGVGCATMDANINTAAERHCTYYTNNRATQSCIANAHAEVMGCMDFVAARFDGRMRAAGYTGAPAFENMHFIGNGTSAVNGWIDSVWHRTPVLSPWVGVFGYGSVGACDTADYGSGGGARDAVAVYPYDGQTAVPTSFDGRREGPNPPAPPTGWPSGYPIHLYAQTTVTEHVLTVDGQTTPIDHLWLAPGAPEAMGLLRTEFVMYAYAPLTAGTRYRVTVRGPSLDRSWVFTTR